MRDVTGVVYSALTGEWRHRTITSTVLVAANKPFMAKKIGEVTTLGIPLGIAPGVLGAWITWRIPRSVGVQQAAAS